MTFPHIWLHLWQHPGERLLIAYHDGEVSDKVRARIHDHLQRCFECQSKAAQISQEWTHLSALNAAIETGISKAELAESMQNTIRMAPGSDDARKQMAAVLEVYLGKRAAAAVLTGQVAPGAHAYDGLESADALLRTLLGKKSAKAIESRLVRIKGSSIS